MPEFGVVGDPAEKLFLLCRQSKASGEPWWAIHGEPCEVAACLIVGRPGHTATQFRCIVAQRRLLCDRSVELLREEPKAVIAPH
jgi:hypothetical protein